MSLSILLAVSTIVLEVRSTAPAAANAAPAATVVHAVPAVYNFTQPMRRDPSISKVKAHQASYRRVVEERKRKAAHRRRVRHSSVVWAHTHDAIKVANCESGGSWSARTYQGNVHDRNNPDYRGKWQIGWSEWRYFGGHGDPADASESEQDYRAWRYWMRSGWRPWQCASMTGVS